MTNINFGILGLHRIRDNTVIWKKSGENMQIVVDIAWHNLQIAQIPKKYECIDNAKRQFLLSELYRYKIILLKCMHNLQF